ncbi:MAG: WG repeat-containing protein [Evtepia gabavorous]
MNLRKAAIQVPCQMAYDDVWHWENGLIKVSKEGLWGFIDERGNVVIPVEDDSLSTWPFPGFFSDLPSVCSCRTETARNNEFLHWHPLRPISRHGGDVPAESPFPP